MMDIIKAFDFVFSLLGLIILSPVILLIAITIKLTSKGPVFFKQIRVGKNGKDFEVFKFRTMQPNADQKGLLTVSGKDSRVTEVGFYLRKFKFDELPQLFNVLKGEMSIVGPRPEVKKYVDLYTPEQRRALLVLPGITDYASITYRNENDLLALAPDPEEFYMREILPKKIELNFRYINNRNIKEYFVIIGKTIVTALKGK
jgi:lipopolysaccharide/colanic/teichoic acid biosynthesis glycosyltransferase